LPAFPVLFCQSFVKEAVYAIRQRLAWVLHLYTSKQLINIFHVPYSGNKYSMILHVTINSCIASYQITSEIDGIYNGKLMSRIPGLFQSQVPDQIILIKTNGHWVSDHSPKDLGLILGNKIDEYEGNL
jgi:hypothetical protein